MPDETLTVEGTSTAEAERVAEAPKAAGKTEITKQSYFFPEGEFSCEAASLEEATRLYEEHQKGARK